MRLRSVLELAGALVALMLAARYAEAAVAPKVDQTLEQKIVDAAVANHIDPQLLLAIYQTESRMNVAAINHITHDYGIGQINIKTIRHYHFDMKKLLVDADYSIASSIKVLYDIKKQHVKHEPLTWFCRYNVGAGPMVGAKSKNCSIYTKRVFISSKIVQARGLIAYQIWND